MMGASPHRSRAALLRAKASGFDAEHHPAQERAFTRGHAAEAAARRIAEQELGEDLYPQTVVADVEGLPMLASLDGLTLTGDVIWEHKLWREDLAEHVASTGEPPPEHVWQLEHQLLVTGAERVIYVASDGTSEHYVQVEYRSRPERRAQLIAGWRQFAADLAAAREAPPPASDPAPTGRAPAQLPALVIQVEGRVVSSNLETWRDGVLGMIRTFNRRLVTDQDFADAERVVKWAKIAEEQLEAAKRAALAQASDIEKLFRTVDDVKGELRDLRLDLERLVKARKEAIRREIQQEALGTVTDWLRAEAADLGNYAPRVPADGAIRIAEAMKARKTVATLREAAQGAAAALRAELSVQIAQVRAGLERARHLEREVGGSHLWPDLRELLGRGIDPDHLEAVLRQRVADARAAEARAATDAATDAAPAQAELTLVTAGRVEVPATDTITIQEIARRIQPLAITPYGLEQLGFRPLTTYPDMIRYSVDAWPLIVDVLINHLRRVRSERWEEER
jgi:predicted phage-related endonuclease